MGAPPVAGPLYPTGAKGIGQILEPKTGTSISFEELVGSLASKDVVFVGEIHDNPDHHLIQIQILQALLDRWGSNAAIGMEYFPRPVQGILDRYVEGRRTESEFLAAVDWNRIWGFDYRFYRPLMLEAKDRSVRVLALNADQEIVRKVAREGFSALTEQERGRIAGDIDLGNMEEREFLRKAFGEHAHADLKSFENFYAAQAVWEETMAETIASHLRTNGGKMIVFMGNGHIVHKFGVPDRTARRTPVKLATLVPLPASGYAQGNGDLGDFVWLTQACPSHVPMTGSMRP